MENNDGLCLEKNPITKETSLRVVCVELKPEQIMSTVEPKSSDEIVLLLYDNNNSFILENLNFDLYLAQKYAQMLMQSSNETNSTEPYLICYKTYLNNWFSGQSQFHTIFYYNNTGIKFKCIRLCSNIFCMPKNVANEANIENHLECIVNIVNYLKIRTESKAMFVCNEYLEKMMNRGECILEAIPLCQNGSFLFFKGEKLGCDYEDTDFVDNRGKNCLVVKFHNNRVDFNDLSSKITRNFFNCNENINNGYLLPNENCGYWRNKIIDVYGVFDQIETTSENNGDFSNVCLCFNGGKDCTVLLNLWATYLKSKYPVDWMNHLQILIINYDDNFEEIIDFFNSMVVGYQLRSVFEVDGKQGLISALFHFTKCQPHINTFLMGSRRSDKNCENLKTFAPSDKNYPKLTRVNPILEWTYNDVWNYLLDANVPYCKLYDSGYTSLGKRSSTSQNLDLFDSTTQMYLPAHKLSDTSHERANRTLN